jgi:hypothetical protein
VNAVKVLDNKDLEARGASLARSNDGPGEEKLPNLEKKKKKKLLLASLEVYNTSPQMRNTYSVPALAELGLDSIAVSDPVAVPAPKSGRVVYTDRVHAVGFRQSCAKSPPCHVISLLTS